MSSTRACSDSSSSVCDSMRRDVLSGSSSWCVFKCARRLHARANRLLHCSKWQACGLFPDKKYKHKIKYDQINPENRRWLTTIVKSTSENLRSVSYQPHHTPNVFHNPSSQSQQSLKFPFSQSVLAFYILTGKVVRCDVKNNLSGLFRLNLRFLGLGHCTVTAYE